MVLHFETTFPFSLFPTTNHYVHRPKKVRKPQTPKSTTPMLQIVQPEYTLETIHAQLIIEVEMPGVNVDDIGISKDGHQLCISAPRGKHDDQVPFRASGSSELEDVKESPVVVYMLDLEIRDDAVWHEAQASFKENTTLVITIPLRHGSLLRELCSAPFFPPWTR